jgi:hypothetical protein
MRRIILASVTAVCVLGCGRPDKEGPAFTKVEIQRLLPLDSRAETTINDPATVAKLAAFFPNVGRGAKSDIAGGWAAGYRLRFKPAEGEPVEVRVDSDGKVWTEGRGNGDWKAKPGLKEFLDGLLKKKQDQPDEAGWSAPVNGLRGRLVRYELPPTGTTPIIGVALELKNVSTEPLAVLADAEAVPLKLFHADGTPVENAGLARSGPVGPPQVAVLPRDSYLGFSLYDYGWGVPQGQTAFLPVRRGGAWVLKPGKYILRGTFTPEPPEVETYRKNAWRGRLDLPPLEIEVR